ncbi:UNVERIFIED_CONTAM: hypothetical protein K2H54_015832 [Gekko kuhli]
MGAAAAAAAAVGGRCRCCGRERCRADPCGVLCLLLTYLSVGYADYVVLEHVLLQPGFRASLWCPFHAVVFNFIVVMLLASHTRAVFADPEAEFVWVYPPTSTNQRAADLLTRFCRALLKFLVDGLGVKTAVKSD